MVQIKINTDMAGTPGHTVVRKKGWSVCDHGDFRKCDDHTGPPVLPPHGLAMSSIEMNPENNL